MKYDWILDVLTDLRKFANVNGMDTLAGQLEDAELIAAAEIASRSETVMESVGVGPVGDKETTGIHTEAIGKRARA